MKKFAFVMGILALGFAASTPALADFAVVKFKDTGACRAWHHQADRPWGKSQILWARVPTWEVAQAKGAWAMKHHWCKEWYK